MAALDVFKAISSQVDSDFLAMDVLPILWQFSLGPLLNLPQFQAYMTLIKSMSVRVENEQTRKLQELGANSATTTTRNEFMSFGGPSTTNGFETTNGGGEADFEALVRGGQQGPSSGNDMLGGDSWTNASASASASSSTILPSRPSNNRSRSANNASPAATFSWSTPPVSPPPPTNTALNLPKAQSRAITPDNTFGTLNSSFPAMAPINPGIGSPSFALPPQQSRPATSMNTMAVPAIAPSYGTQSSGGGIDWSKASSSSTLASNPWGATSPTPSTSSGLSSFSIAPPPQPQIQNQSNLYSSFNIAPPKPATNSAYSIAPPPSMGMGSRTTSTGSGMNMNSMSALRAQTQGQQQQRQQPQQQQNPWNGSDSLI
jgi:SCY1-like protein 2